MAKRPLLALPGLLAERFAEPIPSYSKIYQRAAGGMLPGTALEFGRWLVDDEKLDAIAAALDLTPKAKPAKSKVAA